MSLQFGRRRFLGGAAGLLGSTLLHRALRAEEQGAPRRLVVLFTPNGTLREEFWPRGPFSRPEEGLVAAPSSPRAWRDFELAPLMAPLAAHRNETQIVWGPGLPPDQFVGGDLPDGTEHDRLVNDDAYRALNITDHKNYILLTGRLPAEVELGMGPSIDQLVADRIGSETLRQSLVLSGTPYFANRRGYVSFGTDGAPIPAIVDPIDAHQFVFGDWTGGEPVLESLQRRRSVLDHVASDIGALRSRLPAAQRDKLEAHLGSIRRLESSLEQLALAKGACTPGTPGSGVGYIEANEAHLELIASSFACDLSRVACLQFAMSGADGVQVDWLEGFDVVGAHGLAHQSAALDLPEGIDEAEASALVESRRAQWRALSLQHAEMISAFLERLKGIPDVDGRSVFDNTLVLWIQEMEEGDHWDRSQLPIVLFGSGGEVFETGQVLRTDNRTPYNDLLLTIARGFGVQAERFGDPRFGTGEDMAELLRA
ncbi:MAG: DUF1552 domain-containing protein [Myxococcota bacterium]